MSKRCVCPCCDGSKVGYCEVCCGEGKIDVDRIINPDGSAIYFKGQSVGISEFSPVSCKIYRSRAGDSVFYTMTQIWEQKYDALFGVYRSRLVNFKGSCFNCGEPINGVAEEKERGQVLWHVHPNVCPVKAPKRRKMR